MFPCQELVLPCRFPMYVAFPHPEYYQQVRLPPQHSPSYGWSFQLAYSTFMKTTVDLPGSVMLPFPSCRALRPRRGLQFPRLYRKSTIAFQVFDPVGPRLFHEAPSLHLRYGLNVALSTLNPCRYLHVPKTRFRVGRLFPFSRAGISPAEGTRLNLAHRRTPLCPHQQ
jgi:hypothetical protein